MRDDDRTGRDRDEARRGLSPEVKAIEAELWAAAPPHQRVAALIVGRATGQEDLPHILAELRSVAPRDALEARLAGLAFALTHAAVENLAWARVAQPHQDGVGDKARLAAVRLAEAGCKCVEALARHRSRGSTEHKVVVTHTGPAAEVAVAMRVRQGKGVVHDARPGEGGGAGKRRRPRAKAVGHAPEPAVRGADPGWEAVPVAGDGEGAVPDARRGAGQRRTRGRAQRGVAARDAERRDGRAAPDGADAAEDGKDGAG